MKVTLRQRIIDWHNKRPYIEDCMIFVLGTAIGLLGNLFSNDIADNKTNNTWRWVDSYWLWIMLGLLLIGVIYYWFFGAYRTGMRTMTDSKEQLKIALAEEVKKELHSVALPMEEKFKMTKKAISVLDK